MNVDLNLGDTRAILAECQSQGILRNQAAYVLATAFWETARTMEPVEEGFYLGPEKAKRHQKTLRYYPYYGRGYVQLTWADNYKRAGQVFGVNMIENPGLALRPDIACKTLVTGMVDGWFTGKKLSDYITLKTSDFVNARRIINGMDKAGEIAAIAKAYDAALTAEGYGVTRPSPQEVSTGRAGFWAWLLRLLKGGK